MPFAMGSHVHAVEIEGRLYVGGGETCKTYNNYLIMEYDSYLRRWDTLPAYAARKFAMTAVGNLLVIVGGQELDNSSKVLSVWRADSKEWTHPYPEMPTARANCSTVTYNKWLVVAGGMAYQLYLTPRSISSVEVLNTDAKQWSTAPQLPVPMYYMKTALVGDTLYLMGGYANYLYTTKVYSISIKTLTSSKASKDMWKEIAELQSSRSAPLSLSGSLLAVGGWNKNYTASIHLYQPNADQWVKIGDLPSPRSDCACVVNVTGEVLVVGGWNGLNLRVMDIAKLD